MGCTYVYISILWHWFDRCSVLDPRISYTKGLKWDYRNDLDLDTYLESSKQLLQDYFDRHYPAATPNTRSTPSSPVPGSSRPAFLDGSPQKVDFTSHYDNDDDAAVAVDELERYFSLPKENFWTTNPINWWYIRCHDFPRLYCLARDILAIPGMIQYCRHFNLTDIYNIRVCCCSRAHVFREQGHHFSTSGLAEAWHYPHFDVG